MLDYLAGKKKFLFGDKATQYDCSVFGVLGHQLYWHASSPELLDHMKGEHLLE